METKGEYLMSRKKNSFHFKPIIFLRKQINYIVVLLMIALFYLIVILFYTHGSLLFNGDNSGFYHLTMNLFTTPTGILEGMSLLITGSNIYGAFYMYVFLSLTIALMSAFYFSVQFFKYFLPQGYIRIAALVSSFLYVITPYILVNYYNMFLGNISITSSFFTLFLAFLIGSYEFYQSKPKRFLAMYSLGGLFLGLSVTLFPNDVRTLFVGVMLFLVFIIFTVAINRYSTRRANVRLAVTSAALFISISFVASLFITLPMFLNIGLTLHSTSVASSNFTYLGFYTGAFNKIPWTIRLLGQWGFPTGFVIYHSVYFNFDFVNIASFFWPVLALIVPLVIAHKHIKNRPFFLFLMSLVICAIFWEKGGNAPFGSVWYFINSKLPFGYEFIPTGTLTGDFLSKIYPVLAVLSIFLIFDYLRKWSLKGIHKLFRKISLIAIPFCLAAMLVVAEAPMFDGQLEANYYKPNTSGFFIPQEYSEIRSYLLDHPGNVLILPGMTTYITFSWNYSGSSYFYNQFFYPANVTTNQNFGGGYGSAQQVESYINITSPILYEDGTISLSSEWMNEITANKYSYILFDKSIVGGNLYENYTYTYDAIQYLINNHIIEPVFTGKVLNLYRLVI